jgi:TolB protein
MPRVRGGVVMKTRRVMAIAAAGIVACVAFGIVLHGGASAHAGAATAPEEISTFSDHCDIGTVLHRGDARFGPPYHSYTLTASGENIWGTQDAFHFAWQKSSGRDVSLSAEIAFIGKGVNPHRKAVLMIRQTLDADSPYVDAALHGSGLIALQYREAKGGITTEIETMAPIYKDDLPLTPMNAELAALAHAAQEDRGSAKAGVAPRDATTPIRLQLVKRGGYAYLYMASKPDGKLEPSGSAIPVPFSGPFYVGIGLSSHDKDVVEQAVFSNVQLTPSYGGSPASIKTPSPGAKKELYSTLETVAIDSTIRTIKHVEKARFEAPNWTRDGSQLLFNREGRLWRFPAAVPEPVAAGAQAPGAPDPVVIDTGFLTRCNNDHGISPDGTELVISDNSQDAHESLIYVLPLIGVGLRRVTKFAPSYWHGWSPDGSTLAYVGQRNGNFDIYTLPANANSSADEKRLTTAKGLDDGPEYTPDGKWIYFNSERTGHMQIWRMHPDGTAQEQVTHDEWNNWFPHFSPDGKWMVMLSYDASVTGHPENKDVMLRLMSMSDGKITVLARLFGGQGTINVPSWSPDSKRLAFVSYELLSE